MTNTLEQIENSIRWIAALISNKHKQRKEMLGDEKSGFCCLGLACHINKFDYEPEFQWLSTKNTESLGLANQFGEATTIVTDEGVGLGEIIPLTPEPNGYNLYDDLGDLNDRSDLSFPEIAEVIIENAEYLFIPEVAKGVTDYFSNY